MKNLKRIVCKNYHIVLLIVFFFTSLFLNWHVVLVGDDYIYKQAAVCTFPQSIQFINWHFINYNGRYVVHLADILFQKIFGYEYIWKILCSAVLCIYCVIIAKLSSDEKEDFKLAVICAVLSIVTIFPRTFNESIYWITGSFNYLFPNVLFLFLLLVAKKSKIQSKWLIVFTVLCSCLSEQVGMMTIGLWVLVILDTVIKKKKFKVRYIINLILACIGYSTIFCMSKTGTRLLSSNVVAEKNLLDKAVYFLGNTLNYAKTQWFGRKTFMFLLFMTLFMSTLWIFKFKNQNRFLNRIAKPITVLVWILTALNDCLLLNSFFNIHFDIGIKFTDSVNRIIFIFFILYVVLYCGYVFIAGLSAYFYGGTYIQCISIIFAFGTQLMMSVTELFADRVCLPAIFMLSLFVISSIIYFKDDLQSFKLFRFFNKSIIRTAVCFGIVFACIVHSYFGISSIFYDNKTVRPLTDEELTEFESYLPLYGCVFFYLEKDKFVSPEEYESGNYDKNKIYPGFNAAQFDYSWTVQTLTDFSWY